MGLAAWRPSSYAPASPDLARLPADKRELINLLDRISAALNDGRAIDIELDEQQVNRWIAARDQLWVEGTFELPSQVHDPQVRFRAPDQVQIAAQVDWGYFRPIAQMELAARQDAQDVSLRCTALRVGGLQLPVGICAAAAGTAVHANEIPHARITGSELRASNEFTWKNGNRRFRVTRFVVSDGALHATLEPLPRKR